MAEEVPEININTEETAHVNRQRTQVRRQYEPVGLTANQRARLATRQNAPTTANVEAPHAQAAQEAPHAPIGTQLTENQTRVLQRRQNTPTTANVEATGDWIGNPTADPNLEGPTAGLIYRGGGPQMGG